MVGSESNEPCYTSAMKPNVTPLERAFQLARSGDVATVQEILRALHMEGYSGAQIEGGLLLKQLRALMKEAAKEHQEELPAENAPQS